MTGEAPTIETCWMCGRLLQGSQYEWRVKVWNDDSLMYTATVDALVCALCAGRASALLYGERNALHAVGSGA